MEQNLMSRESDPAEMDTLAETRQLQKRLKRVPWSWIDPRNRPGHTIEDDSGGPLKSWIIFKANDTFERVRTSRDTLGTKLLLNEFEALQAVRHENVVTLRWAKRHDGNLAVATSWRETEQTGPAPHPLSWLLNRMAGAARGVAAVHRAGFVHGDLKPATILMGNSWTLVSDFKCAAPPGRRKKMLFTPKFAAPEQILGEEVGPAADVYALGMILYLLFIRERFPLILRGAETAAVETATVRPDEMPILGSATTIAAWQALEIRRISPAQRAEPPPARGPDFLMGVKVRFRSQLARVLDGVQHAGLVGDILRVVQTATRLEPGERFKTCEEFEEAINNLLKRLPNGVLVSHPKEISPGISD